MAEAGELPAKGKNVPINGGSPPPAAHCGGEGESSGAGGPVRGAADGEPNAVPIAGVSRRFNVGHLLVAVGLFAVLFCFLRLLRAPPAAYVLCALFCVAISLGQMYLYQGRQPRRASCLVGGDCFRYSTSVVWSYSTSMMWSVNCDMSSSTGGTWRSSPRGSCSWP